MRRHRLLPVSVLMLVVVAACASDDEPDATAPPAEDTVTTPATTPVEPGAGDTDVSADAPFPEARCETNRDAGTITFLTGFDFAAAASIVDVVVAEDRGYYDALCLDVEVLSGGSASNYPLIAAGTAQFASGGSFSEVVAFAEANDADFVVTAVDGRTAIDSLIVKPGVATTLDDLAGTTIGVKFKLPPSIEAMLLGAGLAEGVDYETVLLDGFNPLAHIEIPTIVGFPGWKSNEPGALDRAGIEYTLFDPLDFGIPGSFGAIYTSRDFIAEHPTAAEDFMRATMRGLADALADPTAAANTSVDLINAGGNPNFLQPEGEVFRWQTDAQLILDTTPDGVGFGVPDDAALQAELDAYAAVGLFGDSEAPDAASRLGNDIIASVYDADGVLIWPNDR